jgi:hypothetical protein
VSFAFALLKQQEDHELSISRTCTVAFSMFTPSTRMVNSKTYKKSKRSKSSASKKQGFLDEQKLADTPQGKLPPPSINCAVVELVSISWCPPESTSVDVPTTMPNE